MRDLLSLFQQVKRSGDGWSAVCPAHQDGHHSLSIGVGEQGRWLLKCHAHCPIDAILAAAGLVTADLFPESSSNGRTIVATFDYRDEENTLLYQVVRFHPKDFRQRAPDGAWSVKGIRRVPFRLPELRNKKTVFITEGEKDAMALWGLGLPATTNAGGAGKWQPEFAQDLKAVGCQHVVVLPDNDEPGATHGLQVARYCVDAKLGTKLIPLPGLPPKGDVSDFLKAHTKTDLLTVVKDAPLFDPRRLVSSIPPIVLTSFADFIDQPDDQIEWIVEDRIPAGAIVLLVAPPKTGKSTAARELVLAVSRHEPWLGWRTDGRGSVWLFVFEDKPSEVRKHFRQLGATKHENIRLFFDQAPDDLLPRLHALAHEQRPALIVVDTLARMLKVKDFNDYAEITTRFAPLLKLSRETGATLLVLHHASSHQDREGLDAVLGSTALSGSVDNILILKRHADQVRTLSSVQRIGPDLDPTVVVLSHETGRLERAGSKREFDDDDLASRLLAALSSVPASITERVLHDSCEGRRADKVRVLRKLIGMGRVERTGAGGQKDPYRYSVNGHVPEAKSEVPDPSKTAKTAGTEVGPIKPDLFSVFSEAKSEVPDPTWEPGNLSSKNGAVRTSFGRTFPTLDPDDSSEDGSSYGRPSKSTPLEAVPRPEPAVAATSHHVAAARVPFKEDDDERL